VRPVRQPETLDAACPADSLRNDAGEPFFFATNRMTERIPCFRSVPAGIRRDAGLLLCARGRANIVKNATGLEMGDS
jgi:hypothetical protein